MRTPIIAGNWKMYKNVQEAVELTKGLKEMLSSMKGVEVVLCPPFTDLSEVAKVLEGSAIGLGGQDCYWLNEGAYTGEIAPRMLKSAGCTYCIIGHSERRTYFHETNETVNKKVMAALAEGLKPIMCVGETLKEREENRTFAVVKNHVENGLKGVNGNDMDRVVIAYEPVWAIGTGRNATPGQAQEVHAYIRKLLGALYGESVAAKVRIQYGGSVKPENAAEIMKERDVDGALVGGASLKADSFFGIIKKSVKE
ncbi:MAG: triose-phosphate isomerase [Candidatus Omnitrophica bacterium]|nr:triose-phosphate isomerase [Candidatus Omnitrophota bacterium]